MSKELRGAVVGYGFIASGGHMPAYLERARTRGDVKIVAVADVCEPRRVKAGEHSPGVRTYESAEALLAAEQDLDFIDIATPPSDHARIARLAFDRGLHVLCEKPLATSTEEARDLVERAHKAKRVLFPCHNYRHAPVVKAVRQALDEGLIGDVHLITLHTYRPRHARGVDEWRPDWRRERRYAGGGIAMDHGAHTFYLAFDWLGGYPTHVTAKATTLGNFDTEDNIAVTLTFPKAIATAHLTWTAGLRRVVYTLHGTRGAITVNDDELEISVKDGNGAGGGPKVEKRSVASHWADASHARWFDSLFDEFKTAITDGDWAGRHARDALTCIEVIERSYASSNQGCRELPLVSVSAGPRQGLGLAQAT
jgi:predicted dehydrogenase